VISWQESHISVHASGEVHLRQEAKEKQDLTRLMQLWGGPWFHAFELRLSAPTSLSDVRERLSIVRFLSGSLVKRFGEDSSGMAAPPF
jgi:hypothetical protein